MEREQFKQNKKKQLKTNEYKMSNTIDDSSLTANRKRIEITEAQPTRQN